MWRFRLQDLESWWQRQTKKPLILRGARQVGKSTLVRLFCQQQGLDLHEINLETARLETLSTLDGFNLGLVLSEIETKTKKRINPATSVIFLDEIQANPVALQALRYFYESPVPLAVIGAGSLLEFLLEEHLFSMPVGRVEFVHLGPMTFFEFLRATGDALLVDQLATLEPKYWPIHHAALCQQLRTYFFVGGMPEAVATHAATKSTIEVSRVHASILQTYKADFAKYKTRIGFEHLSRIFDQLPAVLGKKVKYASLMPDEKSKTLYKVIDLFVKARLLTKCEHTTAAALPLAAGADSEVYKLYYLDVGLLHHAMGLEAADVMFPGPAAAPLLTQGLSAEQFAAQHLAYAGRAFDEPKLYYWLKDKDPRKAEIDFLIVSNARVVPVEVKSGKTGTLKSLHYFMQTHAQKDAPPPSPKVAVRLDLTPRGNEPYENRGLFSLLHVPLYMTEQMYALLGATRSTAAASDP